MREIEFYYDFGSPNAYLVHKVLPELAARAGAVVRHVPVLLGGVFKETGNQPPIVTYRDVRGKLAYQAREIERFVARHRLKYHMNPHFPVMTLPLMRGAIHARGKEWEDRYIDAVFNAMWVHGQKMDDAEVIGNVLSEVGLPAREIMAATADPQVKSALAEQTEAAVERGVFGAPTMFAGGEMFFGKDSLPDLEYVLGRG
ncbi:MAG: 2-hydroxychromene-2-carboxylate isomerase [Antarcticimicrobium sp.]|uniref:2-hydroxychromene-2-carboxylate isomerase n=1 Tax=Antarcticimicrobium sp. TaxID=2824147 RepID=UPI00260EA8B6|nr:2-hydroxychromene-2-carboxylate isomerase [Antarcticimicrobium sp.]MDF1715179.1 2-hydroxychromene-2-carboxylate isomerase [Antarcticimicrobium sp.]